MPLRALSYSEATNNKKRNPASGWGTYKKTDFSDASGSFAGQRLRATPFFRPVIEPHLTIRKDQKLFAVGSCFAREIEKRLIKRGYPFLSATSMFDQDEVNASFGSTAPVATYITKYSAFSILNAVKWGLSEEGCPREALSKVGDELYVDLYSHYTLKFLDLERSIDRRRRMDRYMGLIKEADVAVFTFGLCEVWWDRDLGLYTNVPPSPSVVRHHPNRYEFHLADCRDVCAALDELHAILRRSCRPGLQIVCTVSPVALDSTFTSSDVVVANTYSKSLNRVAAEYWARTYDNVHYFPSYEMVLNSDPGRAWLEDRRHPSAEMVECIVDYFQNRFQETSSSGADRPGSPPAP